tara:strand:+ start:8335 stop:8982 length:648 start_codon:yes stop_codon:yes gene_type:complete
MNIGISQRVDLVRNERRDSLDQNWFRILKNFKLQILPIPNLLTNPIEWIENQKIEAFILSGGNDLSFFKKSNKKEVNECRDKLEILILRYCKKKKIPVIGICRGLQIINYFFNKKINLKKNIIHVNSKHNIYPNIQEKFRFFKEKKKVIKVNSYHNFIIPVNEVSKELRIVYRDKDQNAEAVEHKSLPWVGIMWHPEREDKISQLFKNLVSNTFF